MREHEVRAIAAAHAALVDEGTIEPLAEDEGETRRWLDYELASLVENRFFVSIDARTLSEAERARWEPRATSDEPLSSPHGQAFYRRVYWVRDGGERAGTIGLATAFTGARLVTVSSLFTLPSHRRRGLAARVLRRAQDAVVARGGAGLRVPTQWTWQPAVRFYLGLGMWIVGWDESPVFCFRDALPRHRVESVGAREMRLCVIDGGAERVLITATREGDRLGWRELPALDGLDGSEEIHLARRTFAMALATRGFPLIRTGAPLDEAGPEALADRIARWEAAELACGHVVRTPRIPGLVSTDG